MRKQLKVIVLPFIDELLIAGSVGIVSTERDCVRVFGRVSWNLSELVLKRQAIKGVWGAGRTTMDQLSDTLYKVWM